MKVLYVADAAPVNLIADGLIQGLRANGHEVLAYGPGMDLFFGFEVPVRRALEMHNWTRPRFRPDLLWYSDSKYYPDWDGIECPRVYTWVDPNCFDGINRAREADAVFLFKQQYAEAVSGLTEHSACVSYGVDDEVYYPDLTVPKMHDVVCVGTVDEERRQAWTPLRQELGQRMLVANEVWREDLAFLYRRSRIVLDWHRSDVWGDRTVIAMACGACNCTNVVPGLLDVFRPGHHLITYEPDTLIETIRELLANDELREGVAAEGCKETLYRHSWRQRVAEMIGMLREWRVLPDAARLPTILLPDEERE